MENLIGKVARMDYAQIANTIVKPPSIHTRRENIQINEAQDHKKEFGASSRRSVRQLKKFVE